MDILIYLICLLVLMVIVYAIRKPMAFIIKLTIKTFFGGLILLLLNTFGGLCLAVNFVTAAVCGILGIPGLCTLIALSHFV